MTGIKGVISIAIMISLGIALLVAFTGIKILVGSLRLVRDRVLDQF